VRSALAGILRAAQMGLAERNGISAHVDGTGWYRGRPLSARQIFRDNAAGADVGHAWNLLEDSPRNSGYVTNKKPDLSFK